MAVVEKNWQTTRPTIKERNKFMFNNDLFSDVKFVVRKTDGESESKQVIPAHKFVLSIGSPVFEAMFYGELAETGDSIELPDCEYESLLELFRYMYSDEAILSGSNVMGVLYLAKKYIVPSLADKCTEYLEDNLDPSNVFCILPSAQKYEEKDPVDRCWKVIDKQTDEAVKSDGFATIDRSLLEAVVVRDTLSIEEIELFKAVDLWATKECERQGLAADGAIIRFPTIKLEDFSSAILDSDILTKEEIVAIIKRLSSVSSSPVAFPETRRCGFQFDGNIQQCCRFGSSTDSGWSYRGSADAISFSVDKDILLHGVSFFGSENNTYYVELDIMDSNSKSIFVSKTERFPSELLQGENCSYYGFKVMFDEEKVILKKNTKYHIRARISGSPSLYGNSCVSSVQCSGVTFTFMQSRHPSNGTRTNQGQFPELLFSL
ncbi:BTB/POZ domain-containing protein 6-like [Oculina patagonica]